MKVTKMDEEEIWFCVNFFSDAEKMSRESSFINFTPKHTHQHKKKKLVCKKWIKRHRKMDYPTVS